MEIKDLILESENELGEAYIIKKVAATTATFFVHPKGFEPPTIRTGI